MRNYNDGWEARSSQNVRTWKRENVKTIGLHYNPRLTTSLPLAQEIAGWLREQGVAAWICTPQQGTPEGFCAADTDLLITLGGDGTILRAMPLTAPLDVPVFGINLGRVGFLTECAPEDWQGALSRVLRGEGWVEERTMLDVTLLRAGEAIAQDHALNDAVVSRGGLARTIRLVAHVDGVPITRYVADGLILATATGSTAYAYAVGGPILPPWLDNLLLVPAAPHLSLSRPLVLNAEAVVEVEVQTQTPGMLTVDGRSEGQLLDGDRVRIERSSLLARFLRLRHRDDFYRSLVERLTPHNGVER